MSDLGDKNPVLTDGGGKHVEEKTVVGDKPNGENVTNKVNDSEKKADMKPEMRTMRKRLT